MTIDRRSVEDEEVDLAAPETRAAGRWNSAGVPTERSKDFRQRAAPAGPAARAEWVVLGRRRWSWRSTSAVLQRARTDGARARHRHHRRAAFIEPAAASTSARCTMCCSRRSRSTRLGAAVDHGRVHARRRRPTAHVPAAGRRSRTRSTRSRSATSTSRQRGDLLSRVTNDIDNVAQSLQQTMSQMLTSVLLLLGVAIMMFTISPLLAVVALTTVPVSVWSMRVDRRAGPAQVHLAVEEHRRCSTRRSRRRSPATRS